jgi:hypothetical protein
MGNCCGNNNDVPAFAAPTTTKPGQKAVELVDLVEPSLAGLDPLVAFEVGLPFTRILIATFVKKVLSAHEKMEEKEEDIVTIEALRAEFDSPAWAQLQDDDSTLCQILRSSAFKDEAKGMTEDQISITYLLTFGLLHCKGAHKDKAIALYNIIQDGGLAEHEMISAGDKDFAPLFEKLCNFTTVDIFSFAADFGGVENRHADNNADLAQAHETVREDMFLD